MRPGTTETAPAIHVSWIRSWVSARTSMYVLQVSYVRTARASHGQQCSVHTRSRQWSCTQVHMEVIVHTNTQAYMEVAVVSANTHGGQRSHVHAQKVLEDCCVRVRGHMQKPRSRTESVAELLCASARGHMQKPRSRTESVAGLLCASACSHACCVRSGVANTEVCKRSCDSGLSQKRACSSQCPCLSTSTRGGQKLPWSSTASGACWFCVVCVGQHSKDCMHGHATPTPASTACLLEGFSRQAPSRLHILQQPLNSKGVHASKSYVLGPWARGERGGQENCVRKCVR